MKKLGFAYAVCAVLVMGITMSASTAFAATVFSDDFNRPDSPTVGNGWTDATGAGTALSILNNRLTNATQQFTAVNTPLSESGPITFSADVSGANGFGGLPFRYGTVFYTKSDGTLDNGYGVSLGRADANFPSHVVLQQNGIIIGDLLSSFQFTDVTHIEATINPDGSVEGVVTDPNNSNNVFNFSFPPRAVSNSGGFFQVELNNFDNRTSSPIFSWVDNLVISNANDATQLSSLGSANVWVGLKNSDDVGLHLDLKAEVYKDADLVGTGEITSVAGGSSGFNNAHLDSIPLTLTAPTAVPPGSNLSIKVYVRNACTGPTHNVGTARLWYDGSSANSGFDATVGSNDNTYYLRSGSVLSTSTGPLNQKIDVAAGAPCSPYKLFGTWNTTL